MPILSNLIVRIGASTDDFDKQVDRSLNKVKRFAADVTAAGTALSIGFSAPLIAAGAAAIKAGSDMESLTMGLKAVMKSSQATADEMAKLREVAKLPGLGLEEAVKGTIRLQILGNSANESRRIMGELGNALAVVGGGREDFNEVIRQLSQLGAVGKVTKENLDPIIERIPQLAAIIKEKFGAEALGDPAKTFERLGISSQQLIQIITDELAKGERAGNTYKNSWTNIEQAAKDAAAEFGKTLLPIAQRVLDDFLTPGIEKAKALATAFRDLSPEAQSVALQFTAIAAAIPLSIVVLGTLAEKAAAIGGAINKVIPVLAAFGGLLQALPGWGKAAVVGLSALAFSIEKVIAGSRDLMIALDPKRATGGDYEVISVLTGQYREMDDSLKALTSTSGGLGRAPSTFQILADAMKTGSEVNGKYRSTVLGVAEAHDAGSTAVEKHAKAMESAKLPTMELLALFDRFKDAETKKAEAVKKIAEITGRWEKTTISSAQRVARSFDLLFQSYRQLSDAPALGLSGMLGDSKMPKAPTVDLANDNGMADFIKGGKNIGPEGMMTKEQHAAIVARYKDLGKVGKAAMQQVSTVITDLSRGITDVIFKGGKLGDMFKNVALQAAQSITRLLIEGALTNLGKKLLETSGLMAKVFGVAGGAASSAAGGAVSAATGAAGSAAGGIAGGAGQAAGALASGGITAIVGAVSGVVSAVSGVIGNFQFMAMNKTLDLIEHEVRYSQIHLLHTLEKANEYWPYMKTCWESLIRMEQRQMAVGAGGASVVINLNGGDPKAALEEITRTLKQFGVIPRG